MNAVNLSAGHIAFHGRWEYFALESGDVYRAPIDAPIRHDFPVRNGARFVGTAAWARQWLRLELDQGTEGGLDETVQAQA